MEIEGELEDFRLVLRFVLMHGREEELVHNFAQLRLLCKGIWDDEMAQYGCLLIPFISAEGERNRSVFDTLYRKTFRFSMDYRNYYCPQLCGEVITSFSQASKFDINWLSLNLDYSLMSISIEPQSFDENRRVSIEFLNGYDIEYLYKIEGHVIQGLMIAEDAPEGTYFFQTRNGIQFPFFVNLREGYLCVTYCKYSVDEIPPEPIYEMDIF